MINSTKSFCRLFYNCTYIPISYYHNGELILHIPEIDVSLALISNYLPQLKESNKAISYLVTKEFNYYGRIFNKESSIDIIMGPVASIPYSSGSINRIMRDASISSQFINEITNLFHSFPILTFLDFLHVLAMIHYEINQEEIKVDDFFELKSSIYNNTIGSQHTTKVYEAKEKEISHNTYNFERELLQYIEDGNLGALKGLLDQPMPLKMGYVGDNSLRHTKNIFVATITMVTRSAISGGINPEMAYKLSDVYIIHMEKLQTIDAIYQLQYSMIIDFSERVAECKIPKGISVDLYKCIQFVINNTNTPINVSDVADYVGKSRSHISRNFKSELGFNLSTFIMDCKLEEAKALLSYTNKPLSEISNYLCFSSQSHFQNVFKQKYDMTPNSYRNQTHSSYNR